jgi:hypothetical protein
MVVGADQLGQIDANIAALQVEISSALWTNLKDEGLLETNISTP